ncbi:hypothetical protein V8E51_008919 [Hyaloscypha variabilis]|jgi:hypothetical protein
MKASVLSLLGVAVAVSAGYGEKPSTTSTVYTTSVYTITKCASYVTDCPEKGQVTTDYISLYTTVCPLEEESKTASYPATTPPVYSTGPPSQPTPPTYPISPPSKPSGPATYPASPPSQPTYPASPPSQPSYPASPPSPPQSPPTYPASSPPSPPTKPSGPVVPPPVLTTVTISTCVPTVITSIYTVSGTPVQTYPSYPIGTGGAPPKKPTGTGSPTGGSYPYTSSKATTYPYTGAAGANKVGGLLMAVGLVAALL